ncbi:MAG: GIY-YIG nuclease family protein [Bacteroidetes bacterium]|nr:GIY-YIG nuclease family protein [Bacteroidota bacterium]
MTNKGPYYVYIMTNTYNTVLYTGVTNDLKRRVNEHKMKKNPSCFTSIYNIHKLVYYEPFMYIQDAIAREKQIKGGSRRKKIILIERLNNNWNDLSPGL